MLTNYPAYGPYADFVKTGAAVISVRDLNKNNWALHCEGIFNILKDGIETEFVHTQKLDILFGNNKHIRLTIPDYFMNLIMWRMILFTNNEILPQHLFFPKNLTKNYIAEYINKNLIIPNRKKIDNRALNNIIDDTLNTFKRLDEFSLYFANTANIMDDIMMENAIPEYREILHTDFSNVPLEYVKDKGMDLTHKLINYITDSKQYIGFDHGLANAFRSKESIKPRQYKEATVNIGTKPDGRGSIFKHITNRSFINGGVEELADYFIDASNGRIAQILSKKNVGTSGSYARILGLNSIDSHLHEDPTYVCDTCNLERFEVKNEALFNQIIDRYFRWQEDGTTSDDDILITRDMKNELVGKTIYLRSPITCASAARGEGICFRCYGDTAYTNININIGKFAAEIISSQLTQRLLSAKHLLESNPVKMQWNNKEYFDMLFDISAENNIIRLKPDVNVKGLSLQINTNDIVLENEDDDYSEDIMIYNEYVTRFTIIGNDKIPTMELYGLNNDNLYISSTLNRLMRTRGEREEDTWTIPLSALTEQNIFLIDIRNDELSKTMYRLMHIINKNNITLMMDRNQILQEYNEALINGGIEAMSVHAEVLIMNQIRDYYDVCERVDWRTPHAKYQLLTLHQALLKNPSICITLLYCYLSKTLYSPLSFKKHGSSVVDLLFMKQPQKFINNDGSMITTKQLESDREENLKTLYVKTKPNDSDNSLI